MWIARLGLGLGLGLRLDMVDLLADESLQMVLDSIQSQFGHQFKRISRVCGNKVKRTALKES